MSAITPFTDTSTQNIRLTGIDSNKNDKAMSDWFREITFIALQEKWYKKPKTMQELQLFLKYSNIKET